MNIHPLHINDLLSCKKVNSSSAISLLKKGWQLRKLAHQDSYCSTGAAGIYEYCLFDGQRELRQLTNKAVNALSDEVVAGAQPMPDLDRSYHLLDHSLFPSDADLAAVKAKGANWLPYFKHWGCVPKDEPEFKQWLMNPPVVISKEDDRVLLDVPREEKEEAKAAGAFFIMTEQGWRMFCLRQRQKYFQKWIS